jgi:hypothetical protein
MPALLDRFIPRPAIRERFQITIAAPAALVLDVATTFDLQSIPLVHGIFRLRELLLRAGPIPPRRATGLLEEMLGLGWGLLQSRPGEYLVCGAQCQPWSAAVTFTPVPLDEFATYAVPGRVKIAWTLEVEALEPAVTRFSHETRAVATDAVAGARFRRYWRWARFGIIAIRLLLLPAIRRAAERRWAEQRPGLNVVEAGSAPGG